MKSRMVLVASLVAVGSLVAACGGSVCSRAASAWDSKAGTCTSSDGGTRAKYDTTKCEAASSVCTAADTATANRYYDCYNSIPACQAGKEADFATAGAGCVADAGSASISAPCATALSSGIIF